MYVMKKIVPDWKRNIIHESSPSGPTFNVMRDMCAGYSYSYFYEERKLGERINTKCTNENLENLSFNDCTFDIFITQDVFEHINRPDLAFKEIMRCLKKGGYHIFTTPLYPWIKTRARIKLENGIVRNVLSPIYHGSPISKNGCLVTYDWGGNICELIYQWTGMKTEIYEFPQNKQFARLGLEADFLQVLVTKKE